jgi:putative oxidoreductase
MKSQRILSWLLQLLAALIMLQTLFFKFSASEESVYIFSTLGIEPWGRIGTGIAELIASILLLWPRTVSLGALMGIGIMTGALLSHLTVLGIEVKGDKGYLFYLCLTVLISCVILLLIHRQQLQQFLKRITGFKNQHALT